MAASDDRKFLPALGSELATRAATQTLLNSFTIVPNTGNHGCRASVLLPMPPIVPRIDTLS